MHCSVNADEVANPVMHVREFLNRLRGAARKRPRDRDLEEELRLHLELAEQESIRVSGDVDDPRRAARLRAGSISHALDCMRDQRGLPWLDNFVRDTRHGLRVLGRRPGWTAMAILSLAFGIGGNTALYSTADALLWRQLAVPNPGELFALRWSGENQAAQNGFRWGYSDPTEDGARTSTGFSELALDRLRKALPHVEMFSFARTAILGGGLEVRSADGVERPYGHYVSGNYYSALGVVPIHGRALIPADDAAGAEPVVVVSEEYWRRSLSADPRIIGQAIIVNERPFTVVGVLPAGLGDMMRVGNATPDLAFPIAMESVLFPGQSEIALPTDWRLLVMGRRRDGVSLLAIRDALQPAFAAVVEDTAPESTVRATLHVVDGSRGAYDPRPNQVRGVAILFSVFGIILAIVCVNIANLVLSQGEARRREIGVRLAIGGSRLRVVNQLFTESMVLAVLGGALSLPLAWVGTWMSPFDGTRIDLPALLFAGAVSVATGLAFGIAPALRSSRSTWTAFAADARAVTSGSRVGKALVAVQVALSLVLVVGAGLFVRTLVNLRAVEVGFDADKLVTFNIENVTARVPWLLADKPASEATVLRYERLMERIENLPGIASVTLAANPLVDWQITVSGLAFDRTEERPPTAAPTLYVHHNYFETMRIPLRKGRAFDRADYATGRVAVVNDAFERRYFPETGVVGERFGLGSEAPRDIEVIGVVENTKYATLRETEPPIIYLVAERGSLRARVFHVRTTGDPAREVPALRTVVAEIDPSIPEPNFVTQAQLIARHYEDELVFAAASSGFGTLSLGIAMIGLFGLMSYAVARRTREIGVRMTLGAPRAQILRAVLRESMMLAVLGAAFGVPASLAVTRLIESYLFNLAPNDPATIVGAVGVTFGVAALAAYLPARSAARVNPMVALRHE